MRRVARVALVVVVAGLWLAAGEAVIGADTVPSGAREALAPVTKMIATLVAIAIGLGIAISPSVANKGSGPAQTAIRRRSGRHDDSIELFCDLFCEEASIACRQVIVVRVARLPISRISGHPIAKQKAHVAPEGKQIIE